MVDLARLPNKSCPEGCPVISVGTVDRLLKANAYEHDMNEELMILRNVFELRGFRSVILRVTFEFVDEMFLTGN